MICQIPLKTLLKAATFGLASGLELLSYPKEFQAGGRYTITYSPADNTVRMRPLQLSYLSHPAQNTTLALIRPDGSIDDKLAASLYNITSEPASLLSASRLD